MIADLATGLIHALLYAVLTIAGALWLGGAL